MSIRFTCTTCHTVLKIEGGLTEPRKVRCKGCNIVILLTPDEDDPDNVIATVPKKTAKRNEMSEGQRKAILFGVAGVLVVAIIAGLSWSYFSRPNVPTDRAAIEGAVDLDGVPLKEGTIRFIFKDGTKEITSDGQIVRGRYQISAVNGPGIGMNTVAITGGAGETVGPKFNTDSELKREIKAGSNSENFDVKSK